jgi:hypothetical protein
MPAIRTRQQPRTPKHKLDHLATNKIRGRLHRIPADRYSQIKDHSMDLLLAEGGNTTYIQSGIGIGSVIAVVCSWERNKSILWAILAAIFSWFYVVYFALTRQVGETK